MTQSMYAPSTSLRRSAERDTSAGGGVVAVDGTPGKKRSTSTQALDRAGTGKCCQMNIVCCSFTRGLCGVFCNS